MNKILGLIKQFLLLNGYNNLSFDDLQLQFLSHTDFPSFKSISDTFDYFGIENLAANVPEAALKQLPGSFLTLVVYNGKEELVYVTKAKDRLKVRGHNFSFTAKEPQFLEVWTRNVIIVQELLEKKKLKTRPYILAGATAAFTALCVVQFYYFGAMSGTYLLLSGVGLIVSFLLLRQQTGSNDTLVQKVCSSITTNGGCSAVISSDSSKLFGIFSLLEASFAFFSAQLLTLLIVGYSNSTLAVITLLSVPVLAYSIYSQAVVLKDWCVLCLVVSATTLLQLLVLFIDTDVVLSSFSYVYAGKLLVMFALLYFAAAVIIKDRKKLAEAANSEIKFLKFKRNATIFKSLLTGPGARLSVPVSDAINHISFGSTNARVTITAVTNPFCGYCAKSFSAYYKLLKKRPEDINVNLVFFAPYKDSSHPAVKIIDTVVNAFSTNNKALVLEMLYEWYTQKDMDAWEQKYKPGESISMVTGQMLYEHSIICESMNIDFTPATLINGYLFPAGYEIEDIELVMDDLIAEPVGAYQLAEEIIQ